MSVVALSQSQNQDQLLFNPQS